MLRYINKKTGDIYTVISSAIDCTNSRDGTKVVIYCPYNGPNNVLYVREEQEFNGKFKLFDGK